MELRDLTAEDLEYCKENDISRSKFMDKDEIVDFAWTLAEDDKVLAIGGIQKITNCCAWAWVSLTPDAVHYKLTIVRTLKEYTEQVCRTHGICRLQAWSEVGFDESRRLLEHLGFTPEGFPMLGFVTIDTPAQLYVKFFGDK